KAVGSAHHVVKEPAGWKKYSIKSKVDMDQWQILTCSGTCNGRLKEIQSAHWGMRPHGRSLQRSDILGTNLNGTFLTRKSPKNAITDWHIMLIHYNQLNHNKSCNAKI